MRIWLCWQVRNTRLGRGRCVIGHGWGLRVGGLLAMRAGQGGVVLVTLWFGVWCACGWRSLSFSRHNALQRKIGGHVHRFGSSAGARHDVPGGQAGRSTGGLYVRIGTSRRAAGTEQGLR